MRARGYLSGKAFGRLNRAFARLRRKVTTWVLRKTVLRLVGRTVVVDGVRLVLADPRVDHEQVVEKMKKCLRILAVVDPNRRRQLQRHVHQIVVWVGNYSAYDRFGGMHLSAEYLLSADPELVASVLVHETIHLRIAGSGIDYQPQLRPRIEKICVTAESRFLRRFGTESADKWADETQAELEYPWWTLEQRRNRIRRGFESVGIPGWASRFFRLR